MDSKGLGLVGRTIMLIGVKINHFKDSDSHQQVIFHKSHKRPLFGERQAKNSFGGCLHICSFTCNNLFLYLVRLSVMGKKVFQNEECDSTAVKLMNE